MTLLVTSPARPVGLLAGGGRFPIAFAEKARALGLPVVCVGLTGSASPELAGLVKRMHWAGPLRLGRMIRLFRKEGAAQVVMAGKVAKADLVYHPWKLLTLLPDWRAFRSWYFYKRSDNRDDTLLLGIVAQFARDGIEIVSALDLCPELLMPAGILTRRPPSAREWEEIRFGWEMAKKMGELDVGQSVAVKERSVLAVEAVEGTDQAILRAGGLCREGGFVVVKVAKPQQDRRFDVPTIGQTTIETLHKAGARVLAIEADQTIVLDQAETMALADRYGLTVVAVEEEDLTTEAPRHREHNTERKVERA
jgi:DUF1009 family protein